MVVHHGQCPGGLAGVSLGVLGVVGQVLLVIVEETAARLEILFVGQEGKPLSEYPVGLFLETQVDGGEYLKTTTTLAGDIIGRTTEDRLLALLVGVPEKRELVVVEQLALHFGNHMVGLAATKRGVDDVEGLTGCPEGLGLRDPALFFHLGYHVVATRECDLGTTARVV